MGTPVSLSGLNYSFSSLPVSIANYFQRETGFEETACCKNSSLNSILNIDIRQYKMLHFVLFISFGLICSQPKLRKWCTGNNKSHDLAHSTWIGRPLSVRDCIESVLSVCIPILRNAEDWAKRDVEQQMALCYAILGAATSSPAPLHPEAGDICSLLVERILGLKELDFQHHRFLAQVWNSVGKCNFFFVCDMLSSTFLFIFNYQ